MKKKGLFFLSILFIMALTISGYSQNYPFPQSLTYPYGIKPNNLSQNVMNSRVQSLYDDWKSHYVLNDFTNWNGHAIWRIDTSANGNAHDTVSEGQGYGMLTMVVMAGYDTNAKRIFDGMYWFFKEYQNNHGLLIWDVYKDGSPHGPDNATDGDLDIAMALIMADAQWGSGGAINYANEANALMNALMNWNVDTPNNDHGGQETDSWRLTCGDWWAGGSDTSDKLTRPSDFVVNSLRTFAHYGSSNWTNVMARCYYLINKMQTNYSSANLIPDFIRDNTETVAHDNDLEGSHDDDYAYNACRVPWKVTVDYLFTGDSRCYTSMNKIATFIDNKTGGDPDAVCDGYHLNGDSYGGNYGKDSVSEAFLPPFGVAGMVDSSHQTWINDVFDFMTTYDKNQGYYEDSIRMLSALVMSGNWWSPIYTPILGIPVTVLEKPNDGATISQGNVNFSWLDKSSLGVNLYKIDISSTNNFTNHVSGYPKDVSDNTISEGSLGVKTYYWRVSCSKDNGTTWGDWSITNSFNIVVADVIDKFEQNSVVQDDPYNPTNIENNDLGGSWYCGDDSGDTFTNASAHNSRSLTLDMVSNDTYSASSHISLHTTYTLGVNSSDANNDNEWAYWELDCTLSPNEAEQDLSGKTLDFWIKGETNYDLKVVMAPNDTKAENNYQYDLYYAKIHLTTSWQHIQLTFTSNVFKQAGWGTHVPFPTAIKEVVTLAFSSDGLDSGNAQFRGFWLDDVVFVGGSSVPKPTLISPINNYAFLNEGDDINFNWSDESESGVQRYQIDLSSDNTFSSHISGYPKTVTIVSDSVTNLGEGAFYWRARCSTNTSGTNWGSWSSVNDFVVNTNAQFMIIDLFDKDTPVVDGDPYNATNIPPNELEGSWYCVDDSDTHFTHGTNSSTSFLEVTGTTAADGTTNSLHVVYNMGVSSEANGEYAYWELDCTLSPHESERSLSGMYLNFWIKGLEDYTLDIVLAPNATKANTIYSNDLYHASIKVTTEWQHISLPINADTFHQAGWGPVIPFGQAVNEVVALSFSEPGKDSGATKYRELWLDQVKLGPNLVFPKPSSPSDLVISEVIPNPSQMSDSKGEWFEVYNKGSSPVTIDSNWVIGDLGGTHRRFTVNGTITVQPKSYAVLAKMLLNGGNDCFEKYWGDNSNTWGDASYENYEAVDYDASGNLVNNNDGIFIKHQPSGYIAAISWNGNTDGHSFEAKRPDTYVLSSDTNSPTIVKTDTNWNVCQVEGNANGYPNSTNYGTPGKTNSQYIAPPETAPVISTLTANQTNDGSGLVLVRFTGTDAENDTCAYVLKEYSLDNSTWHTMTADAGDSRHSGVFLDFTSTGTNLCFVWDSQSDIQVTDPTVWVRLQVNDGTSNSTIVTSASFAVDNGVATVTAPVISGITAVEDTDGSGNVLINYTGTDAENDTCTYTKAEYSTDNSTWHIMTANTNDTRHNSEPLGFTSSGASLNYVWDSKADLGAVYDATVWVRLQVNDGTSNSSIVSSSSFVVDNENPTIPSLNSPASNSAGNNTSVTFTWNASTDGSGSIDHYVVEVDDTSSAFGSIEKTASPTGGTSQAFATLTEGTKYWRVRAVDGHGNVSGNSIVWTTIVDTNAPTKPTLSSPTNGTWTSNTKPTFTWNASTDTGSGVASYDIVIGGVTHNVTGTNFTLTSTNLSDGSYAWKVRAIDNAGNVGVFSSTNTVNIDTTGPNAVSLSSPADGSKTSDPTPKFIWNVATDAGSGVSGYEIDIGGSVSNVGTNLTYTPGTALSDGSHSWKVRAYDTVGNLGTWSSNWSVTVDTTAPNPPALVSPTNETWMSNTKPIFTWNAATDTGSGVASYDIVIGSITNNITNTSFTPGSALSEGANTWTVRAIDNAGNVSAFSITNTVYIDTNSPTAPTLVNPADGTKTSDSTPTFSWDAATDTGSGVAGYDIVIDGVTNNVAGTSFTQGSVLSEGSHTWKVSAYDAVGNVGTWSSTWSVTVDTVPPPVVTLNSPVSNSTVANTNVTFTWNATSDDTTSVSNYIIQIDDNSDFGSVNYTKITNGTSFSVTGLSDSTTYYWRVRAFDVVANTNAWSSIWTVSIDTDQTIPTLYSPGNGTISSVTNPTFYWSHENDISSNQIVVGSSTNTLSGAITNYLSGTLTEGSHTWKVRVYKTSTWTWQPFTGSYSYIVDTTSPTKPVLVNPADGLKTKDNTPTFVWNASSDANGVVGYDIVINGETNNVSDTNYTPSTNLTDGNYAWKVLAIDIASNKSDLSASRSLTIDTTGPSVPELVNPADGLKTTNNTPIFVWKASSDAGVGVASYDIVINGVTNNVSGTNYTPSTSLTDGNYTWQVESIDSLGNRSGLSASRNLTIDTTSPVVVGLVSPSSNITLSSINTAFAWNSVVDATTSVSNYIIQIDDNIGFGSVDYTKTTNGTSFAVTGMNNGATYYWRVRAYDILGNTNAWSSVWTVSIDTNLTIPTSYGPTNNTISGVTNPTFIWSHESGISSNQIVVDNITNTYDSATTNYTPGSALSEGSHSWMVRVYKTSIGTWQTWSSPYTYIVDTTPPGTVSNPTPADNAVVGTNNITLSWSPATDADGIDHYNVVTNGVTNSVTSPNFTANLSEGSYTWEVAAVDKAGNVGNYRTSHFTVKIEQKSGSKNNEFSVTPNPFFKDGTINITYGAKSDDVKFEVYTMVGSLVKTIVPKTVTTAYWNGRNSNGKEVASGIYLMIMRVDGKMVYHPIKVGYIGRHK